MIQIYLVNYFIFFLFTPFDKVKEDIVRKAEAMIARGDNPDLTVEDVVTEVPGVCFTRLMDIIPAQVLEGMT